jgi:hypothetical protein
MREKNPSWIGCLLSRLSVPNKTSLKAAGAVLIGILSLLALVSILCACQGIPATALVPALTATLIPSAGSTAFPSIASPSPALFPSPTPFPTFALILSSTPTLDRLAEPPLPPNPTQLEKGKYLFWLNCAACHGDRGQGLTEEWRNVYVEDANCWARGCHAGHNGDKGFPIPRMVPAIISASGDLPPFKTPEQLFEFLHTTHPPQNPGFMPDGDYWALTAYLLDQNGRLPAEELLGQTYQVAH